MSSNQTKNKFDERYDIRLARLDEIDELMTFIDTWWRKGHIMARDRAMFEYEYVVDGRVNMMIAKERATNKIVGFNGFLMASKNKDKLDLWGSMRKVVPGSMGLLGLEIVKRKERLLNARSYLSMGINEDTTVPINKYMRHYDDVGKLTHFYCLSDRSDYRIAKVAHYESFEGERDYRVQLTPIKNLDDLRRVYDFSCSEDAIPYKDEWYINRRFLEHPIFEYQVFGLSEDDGKAQALLVCREQPYGGATALRIVDYIGKPHLFGGLSGFLSDALKKYEYVDLYCRNFDEASVRRAGLIELSDDDINIIPNYFQPYVAKNVDIWCATPKGKAVFFKADGDQDRPN